MRPHVAASLLLAAWTTCALGQAPARAVAIRFIDSATGYALQPQSVTTRLLQPGKETPEQGVPRSLVSQTGRATLWLEPGRHTLLATSPNYNPLSGDVQVETDDQPRLLQFLLDPTETPRELQPDHLASLHRDDATLVQGFIADTETGQPLEGVQVTSAPSGVQTVTDKGGFFQFYVPVQTDDEAETAPASLLLTKDGYRTLVRQYLELWPRGDWTYRLSLTPGQGADTIDERALRRRAPTAKSGLTSSAATSGASAPTPASTAASLESATKSTAGTNSTVRVPRNIRVLKQDDVTIDYVTLDYYCKHVLPAEWLSSWGSIAGGSNCLSAGAVAIRCYAINYINNPKTSTYDICGDSGCQNYGTATYSATDTAVDYTANYVLISSSGIIPGTEYSAENNSLTNGCGDGYTQPTGGCLFDPACAGESRYGHGRGMCQWGTARWATGRKMAGRTSSDATPNGYPLQHWAWIVRHYYPTYTLVKGAPLLIGDDIKAAYDTSVYVNQCSDGGITNGVNCPLLANLAAGTTGVIIDGPQLVTADGRGYTWYRVQWNDATNTVGWSKENYLERVFSTPSAPTNLAAAPAGTNQINLSWSDTTTAESGFTLERAAASTGPWVRMTSLPTNATNHQDKNLYPGSTWYYRVCAYNAGGSSAYSAVASATTSNPPPVPGPISNRTITEGTLLTFTNSASAPDFVQLITDFQNYSTETTNSLPLFRSPRTSATTSTNLGAPGTNLLSVTPAFTVVTASFPTNGHGTGQVLRVSCQFTNPTAPWLRLTTSNTPSWPNPVVSFTRRLRLDLYADKAVKVAVGCRETTNAPGTAIGADGGTSGPIEWAGVTNLAGTTPMPTRIIPASNWTTLSFNFTNEPILNFSGGNGTLSTASGLGVLEHLAIVPASGIGVYNLYLDNFAVVAPKTFTYSLGSGAPTNASVNPATGVFTWTPSEAQGPSTNSISIIVTDNSSPALSATNTFVVVVNETNLPPVIAAVSNRTVHACCIVTFTNSATDPDLPANTLTYSLDAGAPANATLNALTGIFTWPTTDANSNSTNYFIVRVTDNFGLSSATNFSIAVLPKPTLQFPAVSTTNVTLSWSAIAGTTYRVQYKNDLADAAWTDCVPPVTAAGATASFPDAPGPSKRFYRVLVVDW